jgi:Cu/Ag efflux pump CusA
MALISDLQARAEQQGAKLDMGGVLSGAQERAAPILATAVATFLGLLPFLFMSNTFGHEVVAPMAIVIIGGLVSSLAVNLFILPALYLQVALGPATAPAPAQLAMGQEEASA